ncbi:hypothetical protein FAM18168_02808 [Lacticaseibacillus paracasei]|nr:hypothetical protein FAM18149_00288 [Lacticaseibacillus paracasei]RND80461.1 hypothetical protein FAM18168_02808 [Lacticaseibacillus paracasei]
MSSKEFDQRKRKVFPEELALKNLKELTEAERAGLHGSGANSVRDDHLTSY